MVQDVGPTGKDHRPQILLEQSMVLWSMVVVVARPNIWTIDSPWAVYGSMVYGLGLNESTFQDCTKPTLVVHFSTFGKCTRALTPLAIHNG